MEKKQEQVEFGYRIIKIHTTKFTFEDIREEEIDQLFNRTDRLNVTVKTSLNIDTEKSVITIDFVTELIDIENQITLINHSGRTSYLFQGLEKIYNKEKNAYDIPDDIVTQIFGIAYTHARALLATEISPTAYKDKYFLPVVDPTRFIPNVN